MNESTRRAGRSHGLAIRRTALGVVLGALLLDGRCEAGARDAAAALPASAPALAATLPHPVLFVTQVPVPADFTTVVSTFGNHGGDVTSAPRGGDLYILYPSGTLRNLTKLAGFGSDGFQGAASIAVREPAVHWSGSKAVFSMVVGAPTQQYVPVASTWQLYEVTGLGEGDAPVVTKVPNQPAGFNNVAPAYGTDDRILFASDRPRSGERHLHPQLDEYEEAPTVAGLYSLDPSTGDLKLLDHSPSGDFSPSVDSFGRVIFTRWDHLQRDQQADGDAAQGTPFTSGTFNYADESEGAARLSSRAEVFPEPREAPPGSNLVGHRFNQFFPWQVNEDGTELETLNHIGRHELHAYFDRSLSDDPDLQEFISETSGRFNPRPIDNLFQVREDPTRPGTYFGVDAPEFSTHASGQVVSLLAPPSLPADEVAVTYVTHRDTARVTGEGETPAPGASGHYRNPLPLSNGALVAVHTAETRADENEGTRASPVSRYAFRLRTLKPSGSVLVADQPLSPGIAKTVSYWDPDVLVTYSGPLWELDPVEVRPRARPPRRAASLEAPELSAFAQEGVTPTALRSYLEANGLAMIVMRNVTTRDVADRQQPFNLRVPGTGTQTVGTAGRLYDVSHLQLLQADQVRGTGGTLAPRPGRRVLAQTLHDPAAANPPEPGSPPGSVRIGADGSVAAFVPSHRAVTWQMLDPQGTPVVRERYWLTMAAGEIRLCTSCHGLNSKDQASKARPENEPQALRDLLRHWKTTLAPSSVCTPSATTLCIDDQPGDRRFQLKVDWATVQGGGQSGAATAVSTAPIGFARGGIFWFFDATNPEMLVKVINGCAVNGKFWVFTSAGTNVGLTVRVTDTATGAQKTYVSADLSPSLPVQDVSAFSCP